MKPVTFGSYDTATSGAPTLDAKISVCSRIDTTSRIKGGILETLFIWFQGKSFSGAYLCAGTATAAFALILCGKIIQHL